MHILTVSPELAQVTSIAKRLVQYEQSEVGGVIATLQHSGWAPLNWRIGHCY